MELLIYIAPLVLVWLVYFLVIRRKERRNIGIRDEAVAAGLIEPASLHPLIDVSQCIGCGACVTACPEASHDVLGIINGKVELVNPTYCIGHGACKAACPVDAITLVFGTATRGLDIPNVAPNFETNVPGMFIAGELGGMGLIRNAMEQGRQAMESVATLDGLGQPDRLDVVIIGAGPAGIASTLGAMEKKLRSVTIEQDSLGGTVYNFPRGKLVMTQPVMLPIVGKTKLGETTKEELMSYWQKLQQDTGMEVSFREKVDKIDRVDGGFVVTTSKDSYNTRAVLLCIGRRGTPRKLGVSGEEQPKVVYQLIDPEQYRGMHVLVVGGGDSALEAACSIAEEEGTTVTISYRSEAFSRAKQKNRERISENEQAGRLTVMLKSTVATVGKDTVTLNWRDDQHEIPNEGVIVCAGGILPTGFLKESGITVETKYGTT